VISDRTPAQLYSLLFGAVLFAVGVLGFAVDSSFDSGAGIEGDELLLFEVNGWHNLVHIASGAVGLVLAGTRSGARLFALGFGAVYLVVTAWGFIDGDSVLGLLTVNTADNFLHLAIAALGLGAGLASSAEPAGGRPGVTAPSMR
jgi:hypothetical protein